jgi:hypothetical protein
MRHENLRKCLQIYYYTGVHFSFLVSHFLSSQEITCVVSVWANLRGASTGNEYEISNFPVHENLDRGLLDFDTV